MIQINPNLAPELVRYFTCDPNSDLTIITQRNRLRLQLSILSQESGYFRKIKSPNERPINLQNLAEAPLLRVLQAIYGWQLNIMSIEDLWEVYPILVSLQTGRFISHLQKLVLQRVELRNSIEFIEFSFRNNFLKYQILDILITTKLQVLQNVHNYLKLNKISPSTFEELLIECAFRSPNLDSVINNIMENYFNRNAIKPTNFFQKSSLGSIKKIWHKFHHIPSATGPCDSSPVVRSESTVKLKSMESERKQKLSKIQQLKKKIIEKDAQIQYLESEIKSVSESKRGMSIPKLQPSFSDSSELVNLKRTESNPLKNDDSSNDVAFNQDQYNNRRPTTDIKRRSNSKSKNKNKKSQHLN